MMTGSSAQRLRLARRVGRDGFDLEGPVHSEIAFYARHLMVSKARGRLASYDITIVTPEAKVSISLEIEAVRQK